MPSASVEKRVTSLNSMAGSISQLRAAWARLERDPRLAVDMYAPASDAQASAAVQSAAQRVFDRAGRKSGRSRHSTSCRKARFAASAFALAVIGTSNQINRALEAISAGAPGADRHWRQHPDDGRQPPSGRRSAGAAAAGHVRHLCLREEWLSMSSQSLPKLASSASCSSAPAPRWSARVVMSLTTDAKVPPANVTRSRVHSRRSAGC